MTARDDTTRGGIRTASSIAETPQRPQLVRPALGQRMIRDAAAAWPALEGVMPELGRTDLADVARGAGCPSLVVWGELDAHAGNGDALAGALGGERLALAGVGHMPMLEVPFSFRRALDGWL